MSNFVAPDPETLIQERYDRVMALAEKHEIRMHRIPILGLVGVVRDESLAQEFSTAGARVRSWAEMNSKIRAWDVEVREPLEVEAF